MALTLIIRDRLGTSDLAVIDQVQGAQLQRRPNAATPLSVVVPRGDVKLADAAIGNILMAFDGAVRLFSGRISSRDADQETVTITALSEESLLEGVLVPPHYGAVFNHLDLAEVARRLLRAWHVLRTNTRAGWEAGPERVNVDTATEPGRVMLALDGTGRYQPNGHIVVQFGSASVPSFHSWDRVRWASDFDPPVKTTMQYRFGTSGTWLPDTVTPGGTGEQNIVGLRGALTDQVGFDLAGSVAAIVQVRVNLYTDDTTSLNPAGQQQGVTPRLFGVELLARTTGRVATGTIPATTGVTVQGIDTGADGKSALALLVGLCEQHSHEFRVEDGALSLAQQFGADRRDELVLRAGG